MPARVVERRRPMRTALAIGVAVIFIAAFSAQNAAGREAAENGRGVTAAEDAGASGAIQADQTLRGPAVEAAHQLPSPDGSPCAVILDVSGSTSHDAATRRWFTGQLASLVRVYQSLAPTAETIVIVYGEDAHAVHPASGATPEDVVEAVESSMGSAEWTNPLVAFADIVRVSPLRCVLHVTDGTLDLPPDEAQDRPSYIAELLAVADDLGRRGVPVVTVAMVDTVGDVWREVATRSGGAYILDPDRETLERVLAAILPTPTPTPAPTPTAIPTPPPTATASPPASSADTSRGGLAGSPLIWMVGVPGLVVSLTVALVLRWKLGRPRLAGWISIDEEERNGS
jgi:hypothetical protein